jgi:hypothetical protein
VYFGSTAVAFVGTVSGTTFNPGALAPNTTYTWGVVAKNTAGTNSSATWTFKTGAAAVPPPGAPSAPNPASGTGSLSPSLTLSWSAAANATSYDVYLGTSVETYVATVTGTSYTPAGLAANTVYVWRVVAKNASGSTSSPTYNFGTRTAVNTAPAAVSVTPTGSGSSARLFLTFSDADGAADISGLGALTNSTMNGVNGCWFYFDRAANTLNLANDSTAAWTASAPGGVLQNSQCTVSNAAITTAGTNVTLSVSIQFNTSSFAGARTVHLYAQDQKGLTSGYQARGTWTVTP